MRIETEEQTQRFSPIDYAEPVVVGEPSVRPSLLKGVKLKGALPWVVVAALGAYILWGSKGSGPDADIDVRKPVARFHELLCENLAVAQESLADFCEGRNPDPSDIMEKSKELASEALRASGKAFAEMDNKYLRDGTPSERVEYLRSIAKEFRRWK